MTPARDIAEFLGKEDGFFIASHIRPEGDALGASLALFLALRAIGKNAAVFNADQVPEFFRFLPGWQDIIHSVPEGAGGLTLVLLDCTEPSRAALEGVGFRKSAVIDHHETGARPGDLNWVDPSYAAAGLMVYEVIKELGVRITPEMASNLYTAIATDTGTFRYQNTSAHALRAAGELVEAGAEPFRVSERVYETWTPGRLRLLGLALQGLETRDGVSVISITRQMLDSTGTGLEDTEGFTGYPRMLKDTRIAALLSELDDGTIKVSLRSKGDADVRRIAEGFGGGGHRNAAGCNIKKSLPEAKEELFKAILEGFRKAG